MTVPAWQRTRLEQNADVEVGLFRLRRGTKTAIIDLNLTDRVTEAILERKMVGAPTLRVTVHDPDWEIINDRIFRSDNHGKIEAIQAKFDDYYWDLVQIDRQDDSMDLTFEDHIVTLLRNARGAAKVNRAKMTRAQFARRLVRDSGRDIVFYSPDVDVKQKIA